MTTVPLHRPAIERRPRHVAVAIAIGVGVAIASIAAPPAVAQPAGRSAPSPPPTTGSRSAPEPSSAMRPARQSAAAASASAATAVALAQIGRAATPAEVRAWDIDVRGDFAGLPPGAGSVAFGEQVWEAKCTSCHGVFGESNEVFMPLVGGTTKQDIETGRVRNLASGGHPHRTTLMRASRLSTLWDYVHRAMPWNAPKSLSPDEVYGVLAYMLNLGEVVPSDFTLNDRNIAETERRLPNRHGKVFFRDLWEVQGKGDVVNPACMRACPVEGKFAAALPEAARNANGNIAEQVRPFGPARGTDTSTPPRREPVGVRRQGAAAADAGAAVAALTSSAGDGIRATALASSTAAPSATPPSPTESSVTASSATDLLKANACNACHAIGSRLIGPAFQEVAARYAGRADAVDYLAERIRRGGQGVWGSIPMPGQPHLKDADARAIAAWLSGGAK